MKHTVEAIEKIKAARKKQAPPNLGRKFSDEWKERIRISKSGKNNPNYGKTFSKKHRAGIAAGKIGEKNPQWKGGKRTDDGYILIRVYNHPRVDKNGYVGEHILVVEKRLGRYLTDEERVHHKNEIRSDNRDENLQLCQNQSEHMKLHDTFGNKKRRSL